MLALSRAVGAALLVALPLLAAGSADATFLIQQAENEGTRPSP